jgi:hypothetical protein
MKVLKDLLMSSPTTDGGLPGAGATPDAGASAAPQAADSARPAASAESGSSNRPAPKPTDEKILEQLEKISAQNSAQAEERKNENAAKEKEGRYEVKRQRDQNNPWLDVCDHMKAAGNLAGDTITEGIRTAAGGSQPQSSLVEKIKNYFTSNNEPTGSANAGAYGSGQPSPDQPDPDAAGSGTTTPRGR